MGVSINTQIRLAIFLARVFPNMNGNYLSRELSNLFHSTGEYKIKLRHPKYDVMLLKSEDGFDVELLPDDSDDAIVEVGFMDLFEDEIAELNEDMQLICFS